VARAILDAGLIRRTRHTVVDPRRLTQILAEVRRRGYAAPDEELEEGISSIAAHVQDAARRIGEALASG
jgi:DNA-binding IclR family transcriptional regulator